MSGNTIGQCFTVTTCGESHGAALAAIVDGCPPGIVIDMAHIQQELDRRKPGTSQFATQRKEQDQVRILSGIFEGKTTGTPIGLIIENQDQKSKDYADIKETFRPGHADYTYHHKYGHRDYRGGGRSSARETAMRVAAGAIAKQVLIQLFSVQIRGCMYQMGDLKAQNYDWNFVETNPFFCPDPKLLPQLETVLKSIRKAGSSIGAGIYVEALNVPVGWGEPVFDRLDADIAKAMMSINAVKGVEIGDGFAVIAQRGEQHRDEITPEGFQSNHAGGVLGGISSGQNITVRLALKPTSSLMIPGKSVDIHDQPIELVTKGRHDPCVGVRATPIAEAMLAITLLDHALRHRGQNSVSQ
mgnify:CR=1 FL=1